MSRMLEVAYSRAARRQRSVYCTFWIHPNARLYWITIIVLYRCANLPRSFVFVLYNKELKLQDESHLSYQSHSHHQHRKWVNCAEPEHACHAECCGVDWPIQPTSFPSQNFHDNQNPLESCQERLEQPGVAGKHAVSKRSHSKREGGPAPTIIHVPSRPSVTHIECRLPDLKPRKSTMRKSEVAVASSHAGRLPILPCKMSIFTVVSATFVC